jgi:uncharacterized protein (DUF488 family)
VNLYTLGYQGIDLKTYIETLSEARVDIVIDVRQTAWSYKRGFCKTALKHALATAGIEYIHLPSAGNPKENRRTAKSIAECLDRFRQHLAIDRTGVVDLLAILAEANARNKAVCLTCFERDASECHRSILAAALAEHVASVRRVDLSSHSEEKVRSLRIPNTYDHKAGRVHKKVSEEKTQPVLF